MLEFFKSRFVCSSMNELLCVRFALIVKACFCFAFLLEMAMTILNTDHRGQALWNACGKLVQHHVLLLKILPSGGYEWKGREGKRQNKNSSRTTHFFNRTEKLMLIVCVYLLDHRVHRCS